MSISYDPMERRFLLETAHTAYAFSVVHDRFLLHEYYGARENRPKEFYREPYHPFSPYAAECIADEFSFTNSFLEYPLFGSGDYRCTALRVQSGNGDSCTSFSYQDHEIFMGRQEIPGIPSARVQKDTETLRIRLDDDVTGCLLTLCYTVFPEYDVITRYFTLENRGGCRVTIKKAMCLSLDIQGHAFDMLSLAGRYGSERSNVQRVPLSIGNHSIMSRRGASGHYLNPFLALVGTDTTEEAGEVYAFNLVYSGSFLDEVEVDPNGNTRVGIGLGSEDFAYSLEPGEDFASPEAVMLYTTEGLGGMSRRMHGFIRAAIVPEEPFSKRPIVLNTWEACLFNIDEKLLIDFAREGIQYGMDMLVMDDGWFGQRKCDNAGLGDWYANTEKFPNGLKKFVLKVKETGMRFGIWIEPEMVNPDSDLYRTHPDWCLACRDREPSLSRGQLVLDMSNPAVLDYLKESFGKTFADVPIDYIKWDFNRNLSEVGSFYLPESRQEEAWYRFQLGVYDLYYWFRKTYPNIMIENCSGGGGRYDLAMMALSTQIWTSDSTSAAKRMKIQYGSTIAYPACVMSCHVSDPDSGENALAQLDYKYKTALGGMLGYELHILKASQEIKDEISRQIKFYRQIEDLIKCGDQYRLLSPLETVCEAFAYYYTASPQMKEESGNRILLTYLQNKGIGQAAPFVLRVAAADKNAVYHEQLSGNTYTGLSLCEGLTVTPSEQDEYSCMWYFVKANGV